MGTSNLYFFIFGRNPKLSQAEIFSYLSSYSISTEIVCVENNFLILSIQGKFNLPHAANALAGTLKVGKIYLRVDIDEDLYTLLQKTDFYLTDSKTHTYSLSLFGKRTKEQNFQELFKSLYKSHKEKAILKKTHPSGLYNALQKENYIDIVVCNSKSFFYIGCTSAAYNIRENKRRYEQRPYIDESIGSSVRFSRILLNLSQKTQGVLLDPFCGIGTILQEAMLQGFEVIGTELLKERVMQCSENLDWLKAQYNLKDASFQIFQADVRDLHHKIQHASVDTIVTEPELGPLLKVIPNYSEAKSTLLTLQELYASTFKSVNSILIPAGTFVIVLPQIATSDNRVLIPDVSALLRNTQLQMIPHLSCSGHNMSFPLYYKEKWHRLGRLVFLFRKL